MVKYRDLYPNATEDEYLYKKVPRNERRVRCIKLKYSEEQKNSEKELEKKMAIEGN